MLRRLVAFVLLAVLLAASVEAASAKRPSARPASVKVVECRSADGGDSRSATFQGRVRARRGSARLGMRFTLLERFGDERRHPVFFPELRAWQLSKPGIRDFRYNQTVTGLQGGGEYRVRVDYRWYDRDGDVVRTARRTSGPCRQPGGLANLRPGSPSAVRGPMGTSVYAVPVHNRGRATARDVEVELSVDGAATDVGHIDAIAAGQTREVYIAGPACQSGVRIVVDPADSVKERRESDNVIEVPCPPRAG